MATDYKQLVENKRQAMVNALLESIEKNPTKWERGWYALDVPYNATTGKNYNGLNALLLDAVAQLRGYKDGRWVTFNQAKELGASIKAGEKSSDVFYWSQYDKKTKKPFDPDTVKGMTDDERKEYMQENVRPVLKFYQVFNAAQCKDFPENTRRNAKSEDEIANQNIQIETIIKNSSAPISYDGKDRAYYSSSTDSIHLPLIESFKTSQDYYATALHEIAHSTGHSSRLNRKMGNLFGSEEYAVEELRAELASVFMQAELGINLGEAEIANHGAYLNSWLGVVKKDINVFYRAAADAGKISTYINENYLKASKEETQQAQQVEQAHQVKTPQDLYRHYQEIKESTPNAIYFQRIGDFYEVMGDDAKPISEELGLTLTSRDVGLSERIPMIGVPYHAVDLYVEKLRDKYNVLIDRENGLESLKRRMTAEEQEKLVIDTIAGNTPSSQKTVNAEWVALASTVELSRVLEIAKKYGSDIKDGELTITEQMRGAKQESNGTQPVQQVEQARQVEQVKQVELVMPLENRMKEYGKSTMIKMPNDSEYSSFVFLTPTKFSQADEKNVRLVVPSNFEFTLSNDGRELVLTGEELRTVLDGKKIGKSAHRVAPSKRNAERLEAIRNNTPAEMKDMPNWCVYRTKWNAEKGKKDKFVLSVHDGKWAKINDRSTWTDFESAYKYALENNCDGLSFALDGSGITCIDLDKCIDTDDKLNDAAQKLAPELAGTYVERSASGNGLHFFLKDDILANNTIANRAVTPGGAEIEVYDTARFISMTGDLFGKSKQSDLSNLSDKPNKLGKCPMQTMSWLRTALGPKNKLSSQSNPQNSSERRTTDLRYQSDSEVLERIRRSRKGEQFDTLYGGGDITGDKSRDDLAFLNTLAFFTDCNEQQMQRIFEGSGRFRPETKNAAYLQRSIRKACDSLSVRFGQNQTTKPGKGKK